MKTVKEVLMKRILKVRLWKVFGILNALFVVPQHLPNLMHKRSFAKIAIKNLN